jgi:hypothetical protein
MKKIAIGHAEIPEAWGWYCPNERLAETLHAQLRCSVPESDLLSVEMVAYHQDQDDVLLRHHDQPDRFTVIHLTRKPDATHSPVVFHGTFPEFAAREEKRHEIERRMVERPNDISGIYPVCFASVTDDGCGGIWTGSAKSKAPSGPLHHATCKSCRALLTASPTHQEAEAGVFLWEFWRWGSE